MSQSFEALFYDLAARCAVQKINKFVLHDCYGCEVEHPSQIQHDCLMLLMSERIEMYFEEAWTALDFINTVPESLKPAILQRTTLYGD